MVLADADFNSTWDIVVVGAGAAGLLAAIRAAERGRRVLLLEKNRQPGIKILMSGGTRCNLTHATDEQGIADAFGRQQGGFLRSALAALNPARLVELFEREGVPSKIEEHGKIFPVSNKAADVLDALLRRCARSGAVLATAESLTRIERHAGHFRLATDSRELTAGKLIITTGGRSYPGCGTSGDGYAWAAELGHTIVTPRPALTPITTRAAWIPPLRGLTLDDVALHVVPAPISDNLLAQTAAKGKAKSKKLAEARGSFLFTHFGLSGPVVLDVSRAVSGHAMPAELQLLCDLCPAASQESVSRWLDEECRLDGKKQLANLVASRFPRRLVETLLTLADIPLDRRAAETAKRDRLKLIENVKSLAIPVAGVMGFKKAEVTAGGVCLDEVDSRDMRSKLVPGLYFAGEVLDVDGPIGGYNFQAAFSTGWLAGEAV